MLTMLQRLTRVSSSFTYDVSLGDHFYGELSDLKDAFDRGDISENFVGLRMSYAEASYVHGLLVVDGIRHTLSMDRLKTARNRNADTTRNLDASWDDKKSRIDVSYGANDALIEAFRDAMGDVGESVCVDVTKRDVERILVVYTAEMVRSGLSLDRG